jgi:tripartite-type tricarboxylate transporter receptor subunit TctC
MARHGRLSLALLFTLTGAPALLAAPAQAQYPSKRIMFIVPFAAGGSNDILARRRTKLSEAWQVPVVIENQGGASGSLGAARVAKAEPDGPILIRHRPSPSTRLFNRTAVHARTSFLGAAMLGKAPLVLAVSKRVRPRARRIA